MPRRNRKIIKYRKPLNLNIGLLIFAVIFVYMVFSVYTYITRDKIQPYEVTEGSIVNDRSYTGIILRDELVEYADSSGYINYYIREGKRAAAGSNIYSIDETGTLSQILEEENLDQYSLDPEDLAEVKKQLYNYSLSYSDDQFSSSYDTQYSLDAMVMEYTNFNALASQEEFISSLGGNFNRVVTPVSGIISYGVDSYENLDESHITAGLFDRSDYSRAITKAGQLVERGSPVYKIITSDDWSIIFPLTADDIRQFEDETSLRVNFDSSDLSAVGDFSMFVGMDGETYGRLDFSKYMIQFVSDRFVNFEVVTNTTDGLKIPVSSVTTKDFYLVPVDFLTGGGDSSDSGFYKEVYSEDGTSIVFVPTTIYYSSDEYYYIDTEDITAGDYLVKPDSLERYQVGLMASLEGVYNINKGYAVFKQIEILAQNDEFYTVKKGTSYGLSVYDHIVLDASTIEDEGTFIYQ